jgi:Protein of unknown function (DUF3800)
VPMHAYVDDSAGGKGKRRVFVLAGFVNEAEWWARFSDKWSQWLNVHPRMPYLKMDEIGSLCRGWTAEEITRKLSGFVEIIKTAPLPKVTHISHDLDKFDKWKDRMIPPANDPFHLPALLILFSVAYEQAQTKNEQCEVVFDKQDVFGPRLAIMYQEIRESLCDSNPKLSVLPRQPRFEDDKEYVPLQAADMLAWIVRHSESRQLHEFEWIRKELSSLPRCECVGEIAEFSPVTEEDKMGMVTQEQFAAFEERLNTTKLGRRYIKGIKKNYEKLKGI